VPAPSLVLASTSPYRRALLDRLRLPFEVRAPGVEEVPLPGEGARETALRLAEAKARAVGCLCPGSLVIGSDQMAALGAERLGKPGGHLEAVAQLQAMRGKCVLFHTAVALLNTRTHRLHLGEVPTAVYFRDFSDDEIERYLSLERPYDCAGSAKIDGAGIVLVERVVGDDPSALIGLPLIRLSAWLREEGIRVV
jgi:septum formation protein